jgi:hypothetical protein
MGEDAPYLPLPNTTKWGLVGKKSGLSVSGACSDEHPIKNMLLRSMVRPEIARASEQKQTEAKQVR